MKNRNHNTRNNDYLFINRNMSYHFVISNSMEDLFHAFQLSSSTYSKPTSFIHCHLMKAWNAVTYTQCFLVCRFKQTIGHFIPEKIFNLYCKERNMNRMMIQFSYCLYLRCLKHFLFDFESLFLKVKDVRCFNLIVKYTCLKMSDEYVFEPDGSIILFEDLL